MTGATSREVLKVERVDDVQELKGGDAKMANKTNVYEIPATLKQIGFLYRLGFREIPEDLSRDDASKMIDEQLEKEAQ